MREQQFQTRFFYPVGVETGPNPEDRHFIAADFESETALQNGMSAFCLLVNTHGLTKAIAICRDALSDSPDWETTLRSSANSAVEAETHGDIES